MNRTASARLLEILEVTELPEEERESLVLEINELVFRGSMIRLMEVMDASGRDEFAVLMESSPDDAKIQVFFRERVPDLDAHVDEVVRELADDILLGTGIN